MDRQEIQKRLQLSDIESALRLKRRLERDHRLERKLVRTFLRPLSGEIYDEKLKDFPAVARRFITPEELESYLEVEGLKTRDLDVFFRDLVRFVEGRDDYEKDRRKRLDGVKDKLYKAALEYFSERIRNKSMEGKNTLAEIGKLQAPQLFALLTYPIDSSELAYLSLHTLLRLEEIGREDEEEDEKEPMNSLANITSKLGESVEHQLWLERERAKGDKTEFRTHGKRVEHLSRIMLPSDAILQVGLRLLHYIENAGMTVRYQYDSERNELLNYLDRDSRDFQKVDHGYKLTVRVDFSEEFEEAKRKISDALLEEASLHFDPMVIEPLPWEGGTGGGFLPTSEKYRLTLQKVWRRKEYEYFSRIADDIPREILDAINTIQSTPFTIDARIVKFLEEKLKRLNKKYKTLLKKAKYQTERERERYKEAKKAYDAVRKISPEEEILESLKTIYQQAKNDYLRKKREACTEKCEEIKQEIRSIRNKLAVVHRLEKAGIPCGEPVWFVYQMDFRGRIYPVQAHLTPQGDDIARGILRFYERKALDEEGLRWLKIHGANVYGKDGLDKKDFDTRIAWVDRHEKEIVETALAPFESFLLEEADDPVQFLAFCYEYADYLKNPRNFETSLPVGVDGSNNGLQHIGTLYCDRNSAILVNVLPDEADRPRDIYEEVARHTKRRIQREMEKFAERKTELLRGENGLYLVRKEKSNVVYENYWDETLLDALRTSLEEAKEKMETRGKKIFAKFLKGHLKKILKPLAKTQKDKMIEKVSDLLIESGFDTDRLREKFASEKEEIEKQKAYWYTDKNGLYVETVISPLNFVDDTLLERIDRDLVKPNVMTDSYGTETRSKQNQIFEKLKKLKEENILTLDWYYLRILANYIGRINEESIDEISKASARYMQWCKESVSALYRCEGKKINRDKPVSWTTPLGLKVTQVKFKRKPGKEIETRFGTDRVTIPNEVDTDEIDLNRQKSGLAPNFIHSIDSTHMFMSVNHAKREGVTSFMTIHDSFATHASDVDILQRALKKEFVNLHSQPLMRNLKSELERSFGVHLSDVECIDEDFDLKQVEKSKYFFA